MEKLNVIFVVSDTLRRDHLSIYGNDWISTPYLERFAQDALIFENAYTGSFPTVPNRHDIMTGRFTATYIPWAPLPADELVLAQILSDNDYLTMMIVDQPHILENGLCITRTHGTVTITVRRTEFFRGRGICAQSDTECCLGIFGGK